LVNPQEAIFSRVHSFARLWFADPVSRGPITSVRYLSVSITWLRFNPSSRIRLIISSSGSPFEADGPGSGPAIAFAKATNHANPNARTGFAAVVRLEKGRQFTSSDEQGQGSEGVCMEVRA
jgi:hypothetical protein